MADSKSLSLSYRAKGDIIQSYRAKGDIIQSYRAKGDIGQSLSGSGSNDLNLTPASLKTPRRREGRQEFNHRWTPIDTDGEE